MAMNDRAETPEQKRAVIERLYAAWLAAPQQRLCQLIANGTTFHHCDDIFYIEDLPLVRGVEAYVRQPGSRLDEPPAENSEGRS